MTPSFDSPPESLILTRAEVRHLDLVAAEEFGLPGLVLMENAGRALAQAVLEQCEGRERILILCGAGNNGGDGFVCARYLFDAGLSVTLVECALPERLSADARTFQGVCTALGIPRLAGASPECLERDLQALAPQGIVLDALLGTGFTGALREPARSQLELVGRAAQGWQSRVIAVDTPSGFDVDSGEAAPECLCASLTLTLAANKPALSRQEFRHLCGELRVLSIGLPAAVYARVLAARKA